MEEEDWRDAMAASAPKPRKPPAATGLVFVSKAKREEITAQEENDDERKEHERMVKVIESRKHFIEEAEQEVNSRERSRSRDPGFKKPGPMPAVKRVETTEDIKAKYFNQGKDNKKKVIKAHERNKAIFHFEWDNEEDTSVETQFGKKGEYVPLFGKGIVGGVDVQVQAKAAEKYKQIVKDHTRPEDARPDGTEGTESMEPRTSASEHRGGVVASHDEDNKKAGQFVNRYKGMGQTTHYSEKKRDQMTERDWKIFREDNDIRVVRGKACNPIRDFADSDLNSRIVENIKKIGYKKPTPIQMQSITMGISRKDMIGLAPTGSGKSAAFLIPVINYLIPLTRLTRESPEDGPHAIILSPTRELAMQIQAEFEKLAYSLNLRGALLIGGHDANDQEDLITVGVDVIFGTPGRISDILNKRILLLDRCHYVVIDEADLMVDLGLADDLSNILSSIPKSNLKSTIPEVAAEQEIQSMLRHAPFRTTHLFSATMSKTLKTIASKYLRNETFISIGEVGEGNKNIKHEIILGNSMTKKGQLLKWVASSSDQTLVFCNTQNDVESVGNMLQHEKYSVSQYHGGKSQSERETTIERFKKNKFKVLVATDLAGRGLDVEGVRLVINYDCPKSIETYVHRAGRTGRAGKKGTAVTFLTEENKDIFYDLVSYLKANGQTVPHDLENHPAAAVRQINTYDNPAGQTGESNQNGDQESKNIPKAPSRFEGGMVQRSAYY